jgi:hypothetical protein
LELMTRPWPLPQIVVHVDAETLRDGAAATRQATAERFRGKRSRDFGAGYRRATAILLLISQSSINAHLR